MAGVIFNSLALYNIIRHEGLAIGKIHYIVFCAVNFVCAAAALSYIIAGNAAENAPYVLCALWLAGIAYVDYISCSVYDIMEYYAAVPVTLSVVMLAGSGTPNAVYKLLIMLATVILYGIMARAGLFGEGDGDVLAAVCAVYSDELYNCVFFAAAMLLFLLRNAPSIIKNRGRPGGIRPLIPSIYMAYVIILPFVLK